MSTAPKSRPEDVYDCDHCGKTLEGGTDLVTIRTLGSRGENYYCERCACHELINRGFAGPGD